MTEHYPSVSLNSSLWNCLFSDETSFNSSAYSSLRNCPISTLILRSGIVQSITHDSDILHLFHVTGQFPDLSKYIDARFLIIESCVFSPTQHPAKIPDWIRRVSIERTKTGGELPELPDELTRLHISYTDINKLPDNLPTKLEALILESNPGIRELPQLPPNLENLSIVRCSIREIPPVPFS